MKWIHGFLCMPIFCRLKCCLTLISVDCKQHAFPLQRRIDSRAFPCERESFIKSTAFIFKNSINFRWIFFIFIEKAFTWFIQSMQSVKNHKSQLNKIEPVAHSNRYHNKWHVSSTYRILFDIICQYKKAYRKMYTSICIFFSFACKRVCKSQLKYE